VGQVTWPSEHRDAAPGSHPLRAPQGWYPDPARSGSLRYFDGHRWTHRTRRSAPPSRHLGFAGVLLEQAARASTRMVPAPQPGRFKVAAARSLHDVPRSGSPVAALYLAVAVATGSLALVWMVQLAGTGYLSARAQDRLQRQIPDIPAVSAPASTHRFADLPSGGVPLLPGSDPAPHAAGGAGRVEAAAPEVSQSWSGPDLSPWPPAGWAPSPHRRAASLGGDGQAFARLRIPAINLDAVVVVGTSHDDLGKGPGVWRQGAVPGSPGNATISGHRTTYGAWFYHLDALGYGDRIYLQVPGQPLAVYEVRGREVTVPTDVSVTGPTPGVRLTLTTCHPRYSDARRLVVVAEMVQGAWLDRAVTRSRWRLRP